MTTPTAAPGKPARSRDRNHAAYGIAMLGSIAAAVLVGLFHGYHPSMWFGADADLAFTAMFGWVPLLPVAALAFLFTRTAAPTGSRRTAAYGLVGAVAVWACAVFALSATGILL